MPRRSAWSAVLASGAVVLSTALLTVPPTEAAGPAQPPGGLPAPDRPELPTDDVVVPSGVADQGRQAFLLKLSTRSTGQAFAAAKTTRRAAGSARSQLARVASAQDRVVANLPARTPVLFRTHAVLAGVAVQTDVRNYDELARIPGVTAVLPITPKSADNGYAVPLQGAPAVWEGDADLGADTTIGIIDTGVDFTHADFGGTGTTAAYDAERSHSDDPTLWAGSAFPTAKVVGGYDLAGNAYHASGTEAERVPHADPNPLDCDGHGSHVAGSAAGYGVTGAGETYTGAYDTFTDFDAMRIGPGMAPRAKLMAFKVFGCSGTTALISAAIDRALDPNGDGSIADAVDVINISIGSDYGTPDDADALAVDEAAELGVTMVVSAGNAGDLYDVGGTPGTAQRAITVAASTDAQSILDGLHVSWSGGGNAVFAVQRSVAYDWVNGSDLSGEVVIPASNPTGCGAFDPGDGIAGKIALLHWTRSTAPECGSAVRAANVLAAGGVGFVFDVPEDDFSTAITGSAVIPGVMVNGPAGTAIRTAIGGGQTVTVTSTSWNDTPLVIPSDDDQVASFSSRGIRGAGHLKPDVSAVGATVFSAWVGTGDLGWSLGGTSMAAPMVAGLAALVVSARPDWTPEQVKADIMNTAGHDLDTNGSDAGGTTYAPNRVGAGRIDAESALGNDVLAYVADDPGAVGVSFGPVEITAPTTMTKSVTVENTGTATRTYDASYRVITTAPGVGTEVSPTQFTLGPGATVSVTVRVNIADPTMLTKTVDPTKALVDGGGFPLEYLPDSSGHLVLTPTSGGVPTLRVPVYAAPRPAAEMSQPSLLDVRTGHGALFVEGRQVDQGILDGRVTSLVSGFELQASSAPAPDCGPSLTSSCVAGPSDRGADLEYVGVTSTAPYYVDPLDGLVYFAIATHGVHTTAAGPVSFRVYIDADRDGDTDLIAINTRLTARDVFVTAVLRPDGTVLDANLTNNRYADTDIALFDSSVMMLPVSVDLLDFWGLDPADPRISYGVAALSNHLVDTVGLANSGVPDGSLTANVIDPGVLVVGDGHIGGYSEADGLNTQYGPLIKDLDGRRLDVYVDHASYDQEGGRGLLLLHFHNRAAEQAQVVSLMLTTPTPPAPSATVGLTAEPASVARGDDVALSVSVAGNAGPEPTGSVSVRDADSGAVLASGTLADGAATLHVAPTAVGTLRLVAAYAGDATYPAATSPAATLTVTPASRDVTLSASPSSIVRGDTTVLNVGVLTEPGDPTATGTVTVLDETGATVASGALGPDGFVLLPFGSDTPGAVRLHATWSGDENTVPSGPSATIEVTITKASPEPALTLGRTKGRVGRPVRATVTIRAVMDIPATGTVTLRSGRRTLDTAELVDGAARFRFTPRKAGKLRLRVEYGGDATYTPGKSDLSTYRVLRGKKG